jgi:hypothetical protein
MFGTQPLAASMDTRAADLAAIQLGSQLEQRSDCFGVPAWTPFGKV